MVFSGISFLFIFLPLLLPVYFIFAAAGYRKASNLILLIFSLCFYGYNMPKFLYVILLSVLINYLSAYFAAEKGRKGRMALTVGIVLNLGLLIYFKYANFIAENLGLIFGGFDIGEIIMPIGISFFTFQGMSYLIDVYKGKVQVQKNPLNVALYISLFPQLIAGPIVRYRDIEREIMGRHENLSDIADGVVRFSIGLGKKAIIANSIGKIASDILGLDQSFYSVSLAWVGIIAYTFQIYFDFSGYSDMAIGLGRILGFHFPENFNYPYISKSITEFWRRWHMSLSSWFRDYVYIPLGGNRCSMLKHLRNIFIVWILTGIWHGAAWNFILWGLYFAVILVCEKFIYGKTLERLPKIVQHLYSAILIIVGWAIFYSPDLSFAARLLKNMFFMNSLPFINSETIYNIIEYKAEFIIAFICCLPVKNVIIDFFEEHDTPFSEGLFFSVRAVFAIGVFLLSIGYIVSSSFNPFIYFRF